MNKKIVSFIIPCMILWGGVISPVALVIANSLPPREQKPDALSERGPIVYQDDILTVYHNKDIVGYDEHTDISAQSNYDVSGDGAGGVVVNVDVQVDFRQKLKNVANTVVLDLAKFALRGYPYEMELMNRVLKKTPEYHFGDIIHTEEFPMASNVQSSRPYLPFEKQLVEKQK